MVLVKVDDYAAANIQLGINYIHHLGEELHTLGDGARRELATYGTPEVDVEFLAWATDTQRAQYGLIEECI